MNCAKGQTLADGTYLFTCGTCGGKASQAGTTVCTWCFGGDVRRIAAELKTARGQRYYGLLKSFLVVNGKAMRDEFMRIKTEHGAATPIDIGYISLKYDLNYKATWEWLYETRCLRMAYEDIELTFRVRDVLAAARAKYPELAQVSL